MEGRFLEIEVRDGGVNPDHGFTYLGQGSLVKFLEGYEADQNSLSLFCMLRSIEALNTGALPPFVTEAQEEGPVYDEDDVAWINLNQPVISKITRDLLVANENEPVTEKKLRSYFLAKKTAVITPRSVMKILNAHYGIAAGLVSSEHIRESLTDVNIMKHMISTSSIGSVCNTVLSALPFEKWPMVSQAQRLIVLQAFMSPWDAEVAARVTDLTLAFCTTFARAMKMEIGDFYSGDNAILRVPPTVMIEYRAYATAYITNNDTVNDFKLTTNTADVLAKLPGASEETVAIANRIRAEKRASALRKLNRKASKEAKQRGEAFVPIEAADVDTDEELIDIIRRV